jgi:hypothetical protein
MAQKPLLTVDKHFFSANESVRFWISVSSPDPIPESVWESGVVHIVRPDGSRFDQHVSSPIDGDPSRGYKGGWGLGPVPYLLGTYRVSFEFAGKTSEEQALEIVPNALARGVQAYWVFKQSRDAVLRVENHTGRIVRFAELGLIGSEVGISVSQDQPRSMDSRFVPESVISPPHITPEYSFDNLDWNNMSRWPMVSVPPGQSVERTIALDAAFPFQKNQDYDVRLGVTLTLFIGEAGDPEAPLFPERRIVQGTSRLRWQELIRPR